MTAEIILEELLNRGIMLAVKDNKLFSKPEIPADLIPVIKENKSEIIRSVKWRQNIKNLKNEYNFNLAEIRKLESYLDDKGIPRIERKTRIPEFQRLSYKLSDLLNAIGEYPNQEISEGFNI